MNWTSWLDYGFMRSALVAILIITPLFGLLGTMIVNKKMAYFSDALGHSALTGIAVGVICGIQDTTVSMVIFAVIFALLLNKIGSMNMASTDTIISVFSSCSVAIGLAILSKGGNFSKYSGILVGDVLSITERDRISAFDFRHDDFVLADLLQPAQCHLHSPNSGKEQADSGQAG